MPANKDIEQPNNYLAFAVICSIVCFAPLGVVAIYYSMKVNKFWEHGQAYRAKIAARVTRALCLWTVICGLIFWIGILSSASVGVFIQKQKAKIELEKAKRDSTENAPQPK